MPLPFSRIWQAVNVSSVLLSPHEQERLLLHVAADLARRRRERGLRLNYPEATAVIASFVLEGARDGRTVADLMQAGRQVLRYAERDGFWRRLAVPDGYNTEDTCGHDPKLRLVCPLTTGIC